MFWWAVFRNSLKLYAPIFLLPVLFRLRKRLRSQLQHAAVSTVRSATFLSLHAAGVLLSACLLRRLLGVNTIFTNSILASFVGSAAIFVESRSRRPELGLYVATQAVWCVWRKLVLTGRVKALPYGDVLVGACALAVLLRSHLSPTRASNAVQSFFAFFLPSGEDAAALGTRPPHFFSHANTNTANTSTNTLSQQQHRRNHQHQQQQSQQQHQQASSPESIEMQSFSTPASISTPAPSTSRPVAYRRISTWYRFGIIFRYVCRGAIWGYGIRALFSLSEVLRTRSLRVLMRKQQFTLAAFLGSFIALFEGSLLLLQRVPESSLSPSRRSMLAGKKKREGVMMDNVHYDDVMRIHGFCSRLYIWAVLSLLSV